MIQDKLEVAEEVEREHLEAMIDRMVLRQGEKKGLRVHIGPEWSAPRWSSPRQRVRRVWLRRWHGEY